MNGRDHKKYKIAIRKTKGTRYNLKKARVSKGLTREEISDLLGWSVNYIANIENNKMGAVKSDIWNDFEVLYGIDKETLKQIAN